MPLTAKTIMKVPVRLYRTFISPLKPPTCRFYPTCSAYALEAIELHGAAKGSWLAAKRICKCHPFHPGGFDPVPSPAEVTAEAGEREGEAEFRRGNGARRKPL